MSDILLSAQNIHKRFGELEVLKGINFSIQESEVVCFIGASGSGKSTFLRCLNFLEIPDSGTINFQNKDINPKETNLNQLRSQMGMVFQHFNLFPHLSVLSNITTAPIHVHGEKKEHAIETAKKFLKQVDLSDKINEYPARLSGGQKQRVAIARALAMNPKLMLFDEPTSALDPETVEGVLVTMRELAKSGMTMIIVTHEINFARAIADRICFLHEGQILEEASPEIILNNPKNERTKEFLKSVRH